MFSNPTDTEISLKISYETLISIVLRQISSKSLANYLISLTIKLPKIQPINLLF